MFTPSSYTHDQLKPIIEKYKASGGRFFHQTKIDNLGRILNYNYQALFSIATLWGKNKRLRVELNPPLVHVSADAGLMDYVFLANFNRLTHESTKNLNKHLFGEVVIEIDPEILMKRDFFVFPFNVGKAWACKETPLNHKLSDLTTLQTCLSKKLACYEILVRRKIPVESFLGIHFPEKHSELVRQHLNNLNLTRTKNGKAPVTFKLNPIASTNIANTWAPKLKKPKFNIEYEISGKRICVSADDLHFSHQGNENLVFHIDVETGCICEFLITDNEVRNPFDASIVYGFAQHHSRAKAA